MKEYNDSLLHLPPHNGDLKRSKRSTQKRTILSVNLTTKMIKPLRFLLLVALPSLYLIGCASMGSSNTKNLLTASGFRERAPQTEKEKELYANAPSYKVHRVTAGDKTFYAYKDEKSGLAYLGDESNYERFKHLSIQQDIAQTEYQAAQMERDMAMNWYGAYGPSYYGHGYRRIYR